MSWIDQKTSQHRTANNAGIINHKNYFKTVALFFSCCGWFQLVENVEVVNLSHHPKERDTIQGGSLK